SNLASFGLISESDISLDLSLVFTELSGSHMLYELPTMKLDILKALFDLRLSTYKSTRLLYTCQMLTKASNHKG
ncbi:MAG TPA: hypothetical protein ACHBZ9_17720, partial [Arsenophonus nasoniae]|uniref:hypothetical protein n=1 Tax=Arsenophonus nasoniae TaxID=638 RepID=UPI00387A4093